MQMKKRQGEDDEWNDYKSLDIIGGLSENVDEELRRQAVSVQKYPSEDSGVSRVPD